MGFLSNLFSTDPDVKVKKIVKDIFKNIGYGTVEFGEFDEYNDKRRLNISYTGENANVLVGKNGKNIMALEFLTNIIIKNRTGEDPNLLLDVNDYRKNKDVFLKEIALKAGEEVLKTKKEIVLKPLNPYERKIVHLTLKKIKRIQTKSIGRGELKKIIVSYNDPEQR